MKRISIILAILVCVTIIVACVTVNIYFPAAEIQEVAEEIVEEARPSEQGGPDSSLDRIRFRWFTSLLPSLSPGLAYAQVDIDISTPSIRALRASLAGRFESLKGFYGRGALGENNRGYVEIRDQSGLNLKEKADLRRLTNAENSDRKTLYKEILRANKLEAQLLSEVEKIFANSWRGRAGPGSWIQSDNGAWAKK